MMTTEPPTVMNSSQPCVAGPGTYTCSGSVSRTGLTVGLTIFFVLVSLIMAGAFLFKYIKEKKHVLHIGHRKSQDKDHDYIETPQTEPHEYQTRMAPPEPNPIYENLTKPTTDSGRRPAHKHRSLSEPRDDFYLECDLPGDAIYSNDPECRLHMLSDGPDEDVYIVPDS